MIELRLSLRKNNSGALELLNSVLLNCGVKQERIVEKKHKNRIYLSVFPETTKQAVSLQRKISLSGLKGIYLKKILLKDSDWKTRWKKYFKPFNITRNIRVIPLGRRDFDKNKTLKRIHIDTVVAFGTGTHPTTKMVAQFITSKKGKFFSFLDIGTGSGILSVVASCCGAGEIFAIDFDEQAIKTAKNNFFLNCIEPDYIKAIDFGNFNPKRKFDFIAANLLTDDLLRFKTKLVALLNPGGYLAVSGIHKDNYKRFREYFKSRQILFLNVNKIKGWYACLLRKEK
ncbi:MAG: 50S ribosomal protein L11 methyltransferase [Candidatus Omnitrophica bacterium]|nr:50S ribosomal protein L11 methyltransferase [Candidatus Omnitrophota bacterium]